MRLGGAEISMRNSDIGPETYASAGHVAACRAEEGGDAEVAQDADDDGSQWLNAVVELSAIYAAEAEQAPRAAAVPAAEEQRAEEQRVADQGAGCAPAPDARGERAVLHREEYLLGQGELAVGGGLLQPSSPERDRVARTLERSLQVWQELDALQDDADMDQYLTLKEELAQKTKTSNELFAGGQGDELPGGVPMRACGRPVVDVEALNQEVRVLGETIAAADTTRILQRQVELYEQFPMDLVSLLEPRTFGARWLKGGACAPSRVEYGDPRWLDIFSALASLQRDLVELAAVRIDDDDGDALRELQLVWRVVPGSGERVKKHVSVDDIIAREVDRLASGANYLRSRKRSPSFKSALMVRRGVAVGPPDSCTQRFLGEADGAPVDDGYVTQLTIDFDRRLSEARGALEALAEEYSGRTSTTERKRLVIHMLGMLLDRVTELRQRFPDLTEFAGC